MSDRLAPDEHRHVVQIGASAMRANGLAGVCTRQANGWSTWGWTVASEDSTGCEIWSADGGVVERALPVDRGAVSELLASVSPHESISMVWNDGEDPCLMIAFSEGRAIVTLILDAEARTLVGSAETGDVEVVVGGQAIPQPKRLTVSVEQGVGLIGEIPDVGGMLRRHSWHREQ